jgi:hypothetical protein
MEKNEIVVYGVSDPNIKIAGGSGGCCCSQGKQHLEESCQGCTIRCPFLGHNESGNGGRGGSFKWN